MVQKDVIKRNFSKYARHYDEYANIQNSCGLRLIEMAGGENFRNILDIGCGTGNYTMLLRKRFPGARIKAADISDAMIEVAKEKLGDKNISFVVGDAEEVDFADKFDLITSNASFQWFGNLKNALSRYRNFLNSKSVILFSTFGPRTFWELAESLKRFFNDDVFISSSAFLDRVETEIMLKNFFGDIRIKENFFEETYTDLRELFKKIKYSGIKGIGINKRNIWSPKTLSGLEKIYVDMFKGIKVTYQVLFCRAEV